jgi:hypothetical protein
MKGEAANFSANTNIHNKIEHSAQNWRKEMQKLSNLQTRIAVCDSSTIIPLANMDLLVQNTPIFHV